MQNAAIYINFRLEPGKEGFGYSERTTATWPPFRMRILVALVGILDSWLVTCRIDGLQNPPSGEKRIFKRREIEFTKLPAGLLGKDVAAEVLGKANAQDLKRPSIGRRKKKRVVRRTSKTATTTRAMPTPITFRSNQKENFSRQPTR